MRKRTIVGGIALVGMGVGAGALVFGPSLFRGALTERATRLVSRSIGTEVDVGHASVSLLRTFPRVNVRLQDVTVAGAAPYDAQPFLAADAIDLHFDLIEVIRGTYVARGIAIERPVVTAIQGAEGTNHDFGESDTPPDPDLTVRLDDVAIRDMEVRWLDEVQGLEVRVADVDLNGEGRLEQNHIDFATTTQVADITIEGDDATWVHALTLQAAGQVVYGLEDGEVELRSFTGALNELPLALDLRMLPEPDRVTVGGTFSAPDASMAELVSLVPPAWRGDLDTLDASGQVELNGSVDGAFISGEEAVPGFAITARVSDGRVRQEALPEAITDIGADIAVLHEQGPLETMRVRFDQARFAVGDSWFSTSGTIENPVLAPVVDLRLQGDLDMGTVARAVPDFEGRGRVTTDLWARGRVQELQAGETGSLRAEGTLTARDLTLQTAALPLPLEVKAADVAFDTNQARVTGLVATHGGSDFAGTATLDNLLAYAMAGGVLSGRVDLTSRLVELGPFMTTDSGQASTTGVLQLPPNLDLVATLRADEVRFDDWALSDVAGQVDLAEDVLTLDRLELGVAGGRARASGTYRPVDPTHASVDLDLGFDDLQASSAMAQFTTLARALPLDVAGAFSGSMKVKGDLDETMTLVPRSVDGSGSLGARGMQLHADALAATGRKIGRDALGDIRLGGGDVRFAVDQGEIALQPLSMALAGVTSRVRGSLDLADLGITFDLDTDVPTKGLRQASMLDAVAGYLPETVPVGIQVRGTTTDPRIELDLSGVRSVGDALAEEAIDEVKERAKEELDEAKAKLRAEAEARASELVRDAEQAADRLLRAADERADALVDEAGSNPLLKAAARKAADEVRERAQSEADDLVRRANDRARNLRSGSGG